MKLKLSLLIFLISISLSHLWAQKFTISGFVEDAASGEKLINASVFENTTYVGTISNNYGFYSLSLPAGKVKVSVSFVGYTAQTFEIDLKSNTTLNVSLQLMGELEEITIEGRRMESKIEQVQMSEMEIPVKTIKNLPVLLGEVDIIKTIQLLPGVQSGTEGSSGLYVRGGGPDQNLILLDGVPVYNVNHLFGFFSVFNADAINSVSLTTGGFPARYGGRLSSVLDIHMKEGNINEFKGEGSVGIISSRLTLEAPIIKGKSSFIISGRRTYIDVLAQPVLKIMQAAEDIDKFRAGYYFYDLNGKVNYKFSDKSRLYLSAYLGNDKAYANVADEWNNNYSEDKFKLRWGNITTALRWNYAFSPRLFSNSTITYSRYKFLTGLGFEYKTTNPVSHEEYEFEYNSGIDDLAAKIDFDYLPNPSHNIKFGVGNIFHTFNPGVNVLSEDYNDAAGKIDTTFGSKKIYAQELAAYIEDDFKVGKRLRFNAGLRYSGFSVQDKYYHSLEPRISMRLKLGKNLSLKAAYTQMQQYIHLLTNSSIGLPTDLWLPVTDSIRPQFSEQFAAGIAIALPKDFDLSIEGFYKDMSNLIEYKEGASFLDLNSDWEGKVEIGKGWSYGLEVLLQRKAGKLSGWVGYTLAWSWRQFDNISFGEPFPYKYDSRHDLSIVLTYKFNDRIDMGATWVFSSGTAISLPTAQYISNSNPYDNGYYFLDYYESRNAFRMPSYHRLDLGINFHKKTRWGERVWSFGTYNSYNHMNPFFVYSGYDYNADGTSEKKFKQISLFPIIPSVSYGFKF